MMDGNNPKRKKNRLEGFNYAENRIYFITVCTSPRRNLFWTQSAMEDVFCWLPENVGADIIRPPAVDPLTKAGKTVKTSILSIPEHYRQIEVKHFCIMPDHVHLLLYFWSDSNGQNSNTPTLSTVVGSMKRWVSKQLGYSPWQKSFYDHIIRNQKEDEAAYAYIENNPVQWFIKHDDGKIEDLFENVCWAGFEKKQI